jgi:hypothetical protein
MFGGGIMLYINSFIFCGFVCVLGQIILDNTKLTPGHVTSMFVVIGAFLDIFDIYDKIILGVIFPDRMPDARQEYVDNEIDFLDHEEEWLDEVRREYESAVEHEKAEPPIIDKLSENKTIAISKWVNLHPNYIKHLYESEALCFFGEDIENLSKYGTKFRQYLLDSTKETDGFFLNIAVAIGPCLNDFYHLTGDNRYSNDLWMIIIDWDKEIVIDIQEATKAIGTEFKLFSDIVDDKARDEIRKGNPYYKDYHSIYGDDWFYGTL